MKIAHISDIHFRGLARHEEYTNAFELLFKKLNDIKPDVIVNTGDIFHTKTQSISPEVVERMTWMFEQLGNIAPNVTILGNHDGNLTNLSRKDIVSTIIESLDSNGSCKYKHHFSRNTKVHRLTSSVLVHAFSPFDKEGWKNMVPNPNEINVALFHGSVSGCVMDNGMVWSHGEIDVSDMNIFDFVLLGDIHQQQFMDYRLDKNGIRKPYMGYPGSLIQQNFGESIDKGFYVWDIRAKDDWDVEFVLLDNLQPFYTFTWVNNVKDTIDNVLENVPDNKILPGSRFRFVTKEILPQTHTETLVSILKTRFDAIEVTFKHEKEERNENIDHERIKNTKKNLRNDPDSLVKLFQEFMASQNQIYLTDEQKFKAHEQIKVYLEQYNNLPNLEQSIGTTTQQWSIKWLEFGNLFKYGDKNRIDFEKQNGLIGLFGKNKIGKSSVIAATMYSLFNTTDRGSLKASDIINKRKNNCWAKICFTHEGTEYVIERETSRSNQKDPSKSATKVNFFEMKKKPDGQVVKLERNSISRDETDKEIRKLIGTPEDFLMTSLASQGDIMRFINEGSTNRKKILNRFFDIDLFEKLYTFVKNDVISLNAKTKGFTTEDLLKQEATLEKEIERVNFQVENTTLLKQKLQVQLDSLNKEIISYEHKNKDVISLKSNIEKKKASIKRIENELLECSPDTDRIDELKNEIKELESKLSEYDIDNLNALKNKIVENKAELQSVEATLKAEQRIKESLEASVKNLVVIPCGDQFPSCHFIKDSLKDRDKLIDNQKLLNETLEKQKMLTTELSEHAEKTIDSKIKEHKRLSDKLDTERFQLRMAEKSYEQSSMEYAYKQEVLTEHKTELEELLKASASSKSSEESAENIQKYEENKRTFLMISKELKEKDVVLGDLYKNLGSYQAQKDNVLQNKQLLKELQENFVVYSSIQEAFSKTGIPAMILKTQMPMINEELERILMGIVDFKVVLENDISSNAMDVYLEDSHSRRIIELCSGMEKTITSLAIRVALINLSSIPRSDIFIVDEGFTALDEENMQSCLEMINALREYFRCVLIISHEPAIKEIADHILEVQNDGIESRVYSN